MTPPLVGPSEAKNGLLALVTSLKRSGASKPFLVRSHSILDSTKLEISGGALSK
jgi:hypothetical protein